MREVYMANFLIVCGGAGRGILYSSEHLGFDATLQIDIRDEIYDERNERMFQVALPIQSDSQSRLSKTGMLQRFQENVTEESAQLEAEIISAESTLSDLIVQLTDSSASTKLSDSNEVNAHVLQREVRRVKDKLASLQRQYSVLDKRKNQIEAVLHVRPPEFVQGAKIAPSEWRAYIEGTMPTTAIRQALAKMLFQANPLDKSITFWVVASTCGGVGQGVYTHVIDQIQNVMKNFPNYILMIKVVRVGSLTYKSAMPHTDVYSLWGILTDFGYLTQHQQLNLTGELSSTLCYYYLDFPDVGAGYQSKPAREEIVASAFDAINHQQVNFQFDVVTKFQMTSLKVVTARIGDWGKRFNQDSVYEQTIRDLQQKLTQLLAPEHQDLLGSIFAFEISCIGAIYIDFAAVSMKLTPEVIRSLGAELPPPPHRIRVVEVAQRPEWSSIVRFVEQTISPSVVANILDSTDIKVDLDARSNISLAFNPSDSRTKVFDESFIHEVELAQIAIAKFDYLFTTNNDHEGLYKKLIDSYNAMQKPGIRGFFASDRERKELVLANFQSFIVLYAYVAKILAEYNNATSIIALARHQLSAVTSVIFAEYGYQATNREIKVATSSAALHETIVGTKTWLNVLDESIRGNHEVARKSTAFRNAVRLGARSLTESGLKEVLDVSDETSVEQLVEKINNQTGLHGSDWWQGKDPQITDIPSPYRCNIRVFPKLASNFFAELHAGNLAWSASRQITGPVYIESNDRRFALKVHSAECNAFLSTFDAFDSLIRPFLGVLENERTSYLGNDPKTFFCQTMSGTPVYLPTTINPDDQQMHALKQLLTETMAECVTVVTDQF